jgi:serine/threonine-protein kinase
VSTERTRVGRYTLCRELASGGMATVYLARAEGPVGFAKLVAIKRIHRHLAKEPAFVEMFLDEASLAARLHHANVCSVFDFGEEDGSYYIAMEYLVGESLNRVLRAQKHAPSVDWTRYAALAARVIADACEGLHAAHELCDESGHPLHVVHRDISPENLFLTVDGVVKVVDFGIAKARQRLHTTATGELKGKHAYMAPEQLESEHVDRRTDIFSLGVVLWEMLTLHRLFRRPTQLETLFALASEEIRPPSSVQPTVPPALDAIVLRALDRNPSRRYATARELGRDLSAFVATQAAPTTLADVAEWFEQLFPDARARHRALAASTTGPAAGPVARAARVPEGTTDVDRSFVRATDRTSRRRRVPRWVPLAILGAVVLGAASTWAIGEASRSAPEVVAPLAPPPQSPRVAPVDRAATPDADPGDPSSAPGELGSASGADAGHANDIADPPRGETSGRAASAARTGEINVATPGGWGTVYARGRRIGETPLRHTLPVGRHVLEVRPFGRAPGQRMVVRVTPGRVARVVVPVTR